MKRFSFSSALVVSGLLFAAPVFAQNTGTGSNSNHAQSPAVAQKQKTQSNPTSQYNFPAASGNYSSRPGTAGTAMKQHTDGEDVTGNNNFPAASK